MALLRGAGGRRTISERGLTRSDRSPEDQRPIEDLTSKPRPNSEPALSFFFFWSPASQEPDLSCAAHGMNDWGGAGCVQPASGTDVRRLNKSRR
jgi:hypothetical protein